MEPSAKKPPKSRQFGHCLSSRSSRGFFLPSFFFPSTSINQTQCLTHSLASADVLLKLAPFAEKERYLTPFPHSPHWLPSCSVSSRGTNPYPDQVQRSTPVMHQLPDLRERMRLRTRSRCIQSRRSATSPTLEEQIRQSEDCESQRYGSPRIISHR